MTKRSVGPWTSALAICLVVAPALLAGCKGTTRTGTPYTQNLSRELVSYLNGSVAHVHATARRVLETDLGFYIQEEAVDSLEGLIWALTARNRRVKVETFSYGENLTKIAVWVGPTGDEMLASDILSRIEGGL